MRRPEYGSDYVVDLIAALGLEYAAFNPGATFRGLHDSIVNYGGNRRPEVIACTHEEVSVAIAHGYAKALGRPMAAVVHNVVGLQHASMAIFNAYVDRAPVVVLGATGPMDTTRRRPRIDWIHTALVQGNLVRDFVKWDDQPASLAAVPESLARAHRIAMTPPYGPVYVCLDADLQEQPLTGEPPPGFDPRAVAPPTGLQADEASLERTTEWLVAAERPVILADHVGRTPAGVLALTELAEALGAPVIDCGERQGFITTHDLDLTGAQAELLGEADLVLALDVQDLFGQLSTLDRQTRTVCSRLQDGARVVHYTLEGLNVRSLIGDFQRVQPEDLRVAADTARAVPALAERCRERVGSENSRATELRAERRAGLEQRHHQLRATWREQALEQRRQRPLGTAATALAVWEAIGAGGRPWLLANGTLNGWARRVWDWDQPNLFLGRSGGAGLGYGIGAALGGALAHRSDDTLVVDLQSDGDLLFTPGALWTAAHHQLPLLVVMWNNRSYYNSEEHAISMAKARNRPLERAGIGTWITDPNVDFATLARSMGVHGEGPIETFADLGPALERAVRVVGEQRRPALVDVVSQAR